MNVLIVYENNPDGCKFYSIVDPTKDQIEVLELANTKFINVDMAMKHEIACAKLNQALGKPEHSPEFSDEANIRYDAWVGIWCSKEVPAASLPASGPYDRVYYSGFLG